MDSKLSLLLLVIIVALVDYASCLQCYSGSSGSIGIIGGSSFSPVTCKGTEQCYKYDASASLLIVSASSTYKGCANCTNGQATVSGSTAMCCSDKDLCNASMSLMKSTSIPILVGILMVLLKLLNAY